MELLPLKLEIKLWVSEGELKEFGREKKKKKKAKLWQLNENPPRLKGIGGRIEE